MPPTHEFELLCSDVHPEGCRMVIRGPTLIQVATDVQLHGESAHGYTPAFYDQAQPAMFAKLAEQAP